jgi:hypothetical protein
MDAERERLALRYAYWDALGPESRREAEAKSIARFSWN